MAILKPTRGAQYPLIKEFIFNFGDTATDVVAPSLKTFGSNFNDALILDGISLPVGAVLFGGAIIVEIAYVGPTTSTLKLGIAGNDAIYLPPTSLLTAGRTPILLTTPLASNGGADVRLTLAHTVANATAGRVRIRIDYTIDYRVNEMSAT